MLLDVNDDRSVKEAIGKIESEQEIINVLVNNAGYLLIGPLEELSIEEFKEQFETNFFGAVVKPWSNGIWNGMELYNGVIYSIPEMTTYLTLECENS